MGLARYFWWVVGGLSVLALWASSASYAATTTGLVGPKEPEGGGPIAEYVESYLGYRSQLFAFDQWQNWMLTIALLGIGLLAAGLFSRSGRGLSTEPAEWGASALGSGAVVAAVAQVAYLGAVERTLAVSGIEHFDAGSLATMVDAASRADDYVENLGFLMMAIGLILLAVTRRAWVGHTRAIRIASSVPAIVIVAVIATSFAQSDLAMPTLLVVGLVVAPAWIFVVVRTLGAQTDEPASRVVGRG